MKRFLSAILALLMVAIPALAESHDAHVFEADGSGIALTMDDSWFHALASNMYVNMDRASGSPCEYSDLLFFYVDNENPEGILLFALSTRILGSEHVPETRDYPAFTAHLVLFQTEDRELLIWQNESLPEALADRLRMPYDRISGHPEDVSISEPVPMPEAAGFDALHGVNAVDLSPVAADILSGKKLTMVNVWATYCNPCIAEMPELAKLHLDYADKGFQIVGMISDVGNAEFTDHDGLDFARQIIDKTGADYLHVVPGEGMFYGILSEITAVPTTFFIDESGTILRTEVGSRNYAGWAAIVDELLAGME